MRKNLNIPDDLMRKIEEIRYKGRYPTDTKVIMELLEAAADDVSQVAGFCYLAVGGKDGLLKIGYSANPIKRMKSLIALEGGSAVELLFAIEGGQLMEKAAHVKFGDLRKRGEWFKDSKRIRGWFSDHPMICDIDELPSDTNPGLKYDFKVPLTDEDKAMLKRAAENDGRSMRKQAAAMIREGLTASLAKTDA